MGAVEVPRRLAAPQVGSSGDIYAFATIEARQSFVVRGGEGNVVLRDRGVIRRRVLFDTLGDGTPGGIVVDEEVIRVDGPHPGFDLSEPDFCAMVEELVC